MIPEFTDDQKWGDLLKPAMDIAHRGDTEEAGEYVERYVEYLQRRNPEWSTEQARNCVMSNLGYWAGYYDNATREAVQETFGAAHPIFGEAQPTADEAFRMGQELAHPSR